MLRRRIVFQLFLLVLTLCGTATDQQAVAQLVTDVALISCPQCARQPVCQRCRRRPCRSCPSACACETTTTKPGEPGAGPFDQPMPVPTPDPSLDLPADDF